MNNTRRKISEIVRNTMARSNSEYVRFYADETPTRERSIRGMTMKWYGVDGDVAAIAKNANRKLRELGFVARPVYSVNNVNNRLTEVVGSVQIFRAE